MTDYRLRPSSTLTTTGRLTTSSTIVQPEFQYDALYDELAFPENLDAPLFMASGGSLSHNGVALRGICVIDGRL